MSDDIDDDDGEFVGASAREQPEPAAPVEVTEDFIFSALRRLVPEGMQRGGALRDVTQSAAVISGELPPADERQVSDIEVSRRFSEVIHGGPRARIDERRAVLRATWQGFRIDEIPVSKIRVGRLITNARQIVDEEINRALQSRVAEGGFKSVIAVRESDDGYFDLVYGEQRLSVARNLCFELIPALVYPNEYPLEELHYDHLAENTIRKQLTNYEIAARCVELRDSFNRSTEYIAQKTGLKVGTVNFLVSVFARMPAQVLEAWRAGAPELTNARTLQRIAELSADGNLEGALSLWAERRAAEAAAPRGEHGKRMRLRSCGSRPTTRTLDRLWLELRRSPATRTYSREELLAVVDLARGVIPAIATENLSFDPRNSATMAPRRRPVRQVAQEGALELPTPDGRELGIGGGKP